MVTRPMKDKDFSATGKSIDEWFVWLDGIGARDLPHAGIVGRIRESGLESGWWAQGIAVAYEQHIGRRRPGQDSSGAYAVSVTRTMASTPDALLRRWRSRMDPRGEIDGVEFQGEASASVTPKRHYWRRALADGSRVVAALEPKTDGKALLTVSHEKLGSPKQVERWRKAWKEELAKL